MESSSDILKQVRRIEIKTRGLSNDIFAGKYHSAFKGRGMAFSAMLLTAAHLCLRMVGMGFQVYLSGRVGPEGMGLMQLVLSVTALLMTAAMAGIRTGTMYLAAEAIGKGRAGDVSRILRACFLYSGLFSLGVSLGTLRWAQTLAVRWVGRSEAALALRAFAVLLPAVCWNGVMTGYFTAAGRIRALTVVEVLEQFIAMALTMGLLRWAGTDPGRTCAAVVAAAANGLVDKGRDITVKAAGGDLTVNYTDEEVTLTGDAKLVFEGTVEY